MWAFLRVGQTSVEAGDRTRVGIATLGGSLGDHTRIVTPAVTGDPTTAPSSIISWTNRPAHNGSSGSRRDQGLFAPKAGRGAQRRKSRPEAALSMSSWIETIDQNLMRKPVTIRFMSLIPPQAFRCESAVSSVWPSRNAE